jgi:hypothetical protein
MNFKNIKQSETKRLGKLIHRFDAPWRISALAEIKDEPVAMIYHNVSRHNSEIWSKSGRLYHDDAAETLGQPILFNKDGNQFIITAGECGYLVYSQDGGLPNRHFKLDWATTCCIFNGKPVVIDQKKDKKNYVRDCVTGEDLFQMPGSYIALDSAVWHGLLWAAVGWDQGLSCSNGRLYKADMCQCVVNHSDHLLWTSKNKVMTFDGSDNVITLGELPCEKIMHMVSFDGILHIAGCNPDTAWRLDTNNVLSTLGTITEKTVNSVGGEAFGWRISENYFGRVRKGDEFQNGRRKDQGEIYEII